ncbi:MAG: DUF86 domain-containing protein [Candidatus Omnitrophica bacterium]|nr:DUF86 domain-containing protein [Candidatus Omnitrophota bacterium]MBU2044509.1 DUF86 domain-containing protein [Candidatus Omnitrophota bacterium]MBU2251685.1 DUF86 domain-containing protein [Candidatus Omnitrophota bacterium]MBU2473400.1 DUF86 domain-containing protein [Candidatus Omnitrophota bacterium]
MSKRSNSEYLADILEAAKRIISYCQDINYAAFMKNRIIQDAVVRNFEIIGEASKNISSDFSQKYPQIPWNDFAKVRDKLIHHYFGVNLDIVWSIIETSLPQLRKHLTEIIKKIS